MSISMDARALNSIQARDSSDALARAWCVPWLTFALIASFIAVFGCEQRFALSPPAAGNVVATSTLLALGGLSWTFVAQGELYRLLSAPFLHASLSHLIGNCVVFALAGYSLERLCGRAWTFCVFAAGGVAGSAMSLAFAAPVVVSVGASGAIMAMLAALFIVSFRLPPSRAKTRSQRWVAFQVVPALIPFSRGAAAVHVDYGAHLGGALFGLVLGLLLLRTWTEGDELPSLRLGAATLAVCAALTFCTAAYAVDLRYPSFQPLARLMPNALMPRTGAAQAARASSLVVNFPSDPWAHLLLADTKMQRGDAIGAETELRQSMALATPLVRTVYPNLDTVARAELAESLLSQGRTADARALAGEACGARGIEALTPGLVQMLTRSGLCAPAAKVASQ